MRPQWVWSRKTRIYKKCDTAHAKYSKRETRNSTNVNATTRTRTRTIPRLCLMSGSVLQATSMRRMRPQCENTKTREKYEVRTLSPAATAAPKPSRLYFRPIRILLKSSRPILRPQTPRSLRFALLALPHPVQVVGVQMHHGDATPMGLVTENANIRKMRHCAREVQTTRNAKFDECERERYQDFVLCLEVYYKQ